MPVSTGDIDEDLPAQDIRDNYLKDTSVLVVLVGSDTKKRKHIDWDSSMYNGSANKQSGVLVITLPSSDMDRTLAGHGDNEKEQVHTDISSWVNASESYDEIFMKMPQRILNNIRNSKAFISVIPWSKIENDPYKIWQLIDYTFHDRAKNEYDLSLPMMMRNR